MMTILLLNSLFRVYSADFENNQYNYLIKTTIDSQEYLVTYNSKSEFIEGDNLQLFLKVECESIRGLSFGAAETLYGTSICVVLEEK